MKNKILVCFLSFLFLILLGASNVSAHANLLTTSPHDGQVVPSAPDRITLDFGEDLESNLITLKLYDWNARQIDIKGPFISKGKPFEMYAQLPKDLQQGSYTVVWNVVSQDGHPVSGSYVFSIGHVIIGNTVTVNSGQSLLQSLLVGFRYIVEGLILISAGAYWIAQFGTRRGFSDIQQLFPYKRLIWMLLIIGTVYEWFTYSASLPGDGLTIELLSGRFPLIVQSRFATMLLAQFLLLILLSIPQMIEAWYAIMWALLVIVLALGGHAWGIKPIWLAVVIRSVHILSISAWMGALTYFGLLVFCQTKGKIELDWKGFRRFFVPIVSVASAFVLISGIVMIGQQTGYLALVQHPVTWTILLDLKILLFLVMISIAAIQTTRWRSDLSSISTPMLRFEWITGIAVILIGVWISQIAYPEPIKSYSKILTSNQEKAAVSISKLTIGTQKIRIQFSDTTQKPQNVYVQLNMEDMDMEFAPILVHSIGVGTYQADIPFTMSGNWKFVIDAEFQIGEHKKWTDTVFIPGGGS
jgi:copper transport protein